MITFFFWQIGMNMEEYKGKEDEGRESEKKNMLISHQNQ